MRRPKGSPVVSAGNFSRASGTATSTSEQLVQRGLASRLNSGKGSGVKIRSFLVVRWDRTGARAPLAAA